MQSASWYVDRLKSMSLGEIAYRFFKLGLQLADNAKVLVGLIPTTSRLQNTMKLPTSHVAQVLNALPNSSTTKADDILADKLSFFQFQPLRFVHADRWHTDFNQSITAPNSIVALVDYRISTKFGDCKHVWEPNRHHQLVVLARAYFVTDRSDYAEGCVALMDDWISENPYGRGMNWKSPLELGIRIINWVYALMLLDARGFESSSESRRRINETIQLLLHATELGLSNGSSANNHLIGELAGLFVGYSYFDAIGADGSRLDEVKVSLVEQFELQTHDDGIGAEHAFGYQFFVMQFYISCLHIASLRNDSFPESFVSRFVKVAESMGRLAQATGEIPLWGDHDEGYVLDLGDSQTDIVSLIASVKAVADLHGFDAKVLDPFITNEVQAPFWLNPNFRFPSLASHLDLQPIAFEESGYYLLQRGNEKRNVSVLVDVAELGYGSLAAHGHADALSFTLTIDSLQILVDPGTFDYYTYPAYRNYFRSTRAHNTVCIDGADQSVMKGPFLWGVKAAATLIEYEVDCEEMRLAGSHDGYERLEDPVTHERSITLSNSASSLSVLDSLCSRQAHTAEFHFHCHPDCSIEIESGRVLIRREHISVVVEADLIAEVIRGSEDPILGWFSPGYHRKVATNTIRYRTKFVGDSEHRFEFRW